MNFSEPYANGSRSVLNEDRQPGAVSSSPEINNLAALESFLLHNEQDGGIERPEQGEDSADNLDDLRPWELLLSEHDDHSFMNGTSHGQAHKLMSVPIENQGSFHVEAVLPVTNPSSIDALLPAVSRSPRTWPYFVRLVCACNRLNLKMKSKKGKSGKRKRSDKSNKYQCEIRISKKIPRDGKYLKEKVWLGTFATSAQAGRAHDVGKYFLCTKKIKKFFDPKSEAILSVFSGIRSLPLTALVEIVRKMAKQYGENGSLPQRLDNLRHE